MFWDREADFEVLRVLGVSGHFIWKLKACDDFGFLGVEDIVTRWVRVIGRSVDAAGACSMREDSRRLVELRGLKEPFIQSSSLCFLLCSLLGQIGFRKATLFIVSFL